MKLQVKFLKKTIKYSRKEEKMYAIGIDIGTTSICGIVLDVASGKVIKSRTETSNAFIPTVNEWEKIQNAEKIIEIALKILESFVDYPAAVIGLTGQMHGIVYVNDEGKAASPLYTWQDARGNLPYKDSTYADYLGSCSGYGNITDFYNRLNGIRPKEAVTYCTIMDYLAMVLCGLKKPYMHVTNAASLGCFDLKTNKFSYDIDARISNGFDIVGTYQGVPVSVAIGDNQASVFSTLADEKKLLINVGTGSQISIISNDIKSGKNIETRPYFDGKYLIVGAALCGGRAYSILKDFYTDFLQSAGVDCRDVYAVMNLLIEGKKENTLEVDTRFVGTRQNPEIRGQIKGVTVDNFTPANLTYGFLEGMTKELYTMYEEMGERKVDLIGSGNGIRKNEALVRIAERKFEGVLRIPAHTEEAAYGAALFGLVACGTYESAEQVQRLIKYEGR